jgi:hypothetical protein
VAPALALAEPADAQHPLLSEGSAANGATVRRDRRTTTCNTAVSPFRDAPTMPLLPFMHNV